MMATDSIHPLSPAGIIDYWAGELSAADEDRVEAHVFECAACAAALAEGEALANALRAVIRSGSFHALVSDAVLNRLARDGARLRTYVLTPGEVVPCAVWSDDDVVVTRLRGDFSGLETVSVVATLASGEELSRSDDIAVRSGQHELIDAISADWLRRMPATTVRLRVTGVRNGEEQLVGSYTLAHAGPFDR
jgi:hypothetical protein